MNIENKNSISYNDNKIINIDSSINNIFILSKEKKCIIPIFKKNCGKYILKLFDIPKENIDLELLISIILNKINIINEIKKIISNKIEIINIINNFLYKNDIYLFKNYINLYFLLLFSKKNKNQKILDTNKLNNIIKKFYDIFIWFINCGLLNKDIIDYIFQKISKMQLEKTITLDSFNIYLPLIEILYGKNSSDFECNTIAKNYIFLFNKLTSIIKTNISPFNQIIIKNGLFILIWFYLYDYSSESYKSKGTICQIITKDLQKLDIILNNDYDIDLKYNSREILKEKKGHKFEIKNNIWIQLKIQFIKNKIKLFLNQNNDNNSDVCDIKEYLINYVDKINENNNKNIIINKIDEMKCDDFTISYINFFMGYEGLVGSIIFCNDGNIQNNNKKINIISGLHNNKINEFIKKINLKNIYFIIAPSLYCEEENKFIDSTNNINAELSLEKNEKNLNLNSIFKINKYINNIFYLGGCNNILPLFEILYRFSYELNDNIIIHNILVNLFKLLEIIFINKKKNCIEAYNNSYHFFESLQLLLENIDEKYFNNGKEKENCIINSLLKLGKYFYEIKNQKILELNEKHGYFSNVLFYPSIIMKFNILNQNIIFSFFDIIKKGNIFFKINDYKLYFMSFDKISKLLILLTERNSDEYIPSNLFNIIKIIFEDFNTTDNDRENLFLLYNNHLISEKIFINIMEIFIIYFDINTNFNLIYKLITNENTTNANKIIKGESNITMRNNSIKFFLYSSNFFIENLLNILLSNNLYIKKLIINYIRILTNKYNIILEEYFSFVNECNKNYKNKRINKQDFFYFIKENIIIKEDNQKILNEIKNKDIQIKKKRKYSFEKIINKEGFENKKNKKKLTKRKSLDIQFNKNLKKKIISFITKKKKKRKFYINKNTKQKEVFDTKKKVSFNGKKM